MNADLKETMASYSQELYVLQSAVPLLRRLENYMTMVCRLRLNLYLFGSSNRPILMIHRQTSWGSLSLIILED
jgi:hypothetical protein